jgi:large subunit ribosomal protein L30
VALEVTQVKSANGAKHNQLATLASLGLRRMRHTVVVADRPEIRGMVATVNHLVAVREVPDDTTVGAHATRALRASDAGESGVVGQAEGPAAATEELLEEQGVAGTGADSSADVVQNTPQIDPARGKKASGGGADADADAVVDVLATDEEE